MSSVSGNIPISSLQVSDCANGADSRGGEADGQAFLEEALIMKDFHHMNVLPLIGLSIDEGGQLMVIIPYMKYGDLLSYIREERNVSLHSLATCATNSLLELAGAHYLFR